MTAMTTPRHRVSAATAQMRAIADTVTDASVWSMDPEETRSTLIELTKLKAQVAEVEARVAEHADDETVDAWAHATRQTKPAVLAQVRLGEALVTRSHAREALGGRRPGARAGEGGPTRTSIAIRDQGCTEPGCDWPPAMCHTRYDIRFADGGPTDHEHGRLLCPKHHARFHRRT